jgi:hypothetical protein
MAGEARFTLNGEELMAGAGETMVVPAGVLHSAGNPGSVEAEAVVELGPALHTKEWREALTGLVADGRATPKGRAKRTRFQLGATFFWQESSASAGEQGPWHSARFCRTSTASPLAPATSTGRSFTQGLARVTRYRASHAAATSRCISAPAPNRVPTSPS